MPRKFVLKIFKYLIYLNTLKERALLNDKDNTSSKNLQKILLYVVKVGKGNSHSGIRTNLN